MTGSAVTCLKEKCTKKKKKNLYSGYGALTLRMGPSPKVCAPTKVHFHSLQEQLPQSMCYRNKICLFIPTICCLLSLAVFLSLRVFSFLPVDRRKSSLSLHLSQQVTGVSGLVSFLSALENNIIPSPM